jgi:hypothetical protein
LYFLRYFHSSQYAAYYSHRNRSPSYNWMRQKLYINRNYIQTYLFRYKQSNYQTNNAIWHGVATHFVNVLREHNPSVFRVKIRTHCSRFSDVKVRKIMFLGACTCVFYDGIWRNRGVAPLILNLDTRWRWEVSFRPRPLYPRKRIPLPTE